MSNIYIDDRMLSLELLDSIKVIDARIDELKKILNQSRRNRKHDTFSDWLKAILFYELIPKYRKEQRIWVNDRRKTTVKRIEKLVQTRFLLVYSFLDINKNKDETSTNPFVHIAANYSNLKRELS